MPACRVPCTEPPLRRHDLSTLALPLLGELTRFARWLTRFDQETEDLVQEVVTRALGRAETLKDASQIRPWLFQIARNAWLDRRRAAASRDRLVNLGGGLDDLAEVEIPQHEPQRRFERDEIEAALAEMPEAARSTLLLSDLWGFDQEEIALVLDVPVGTVKSRVARARARLAGLLVGNVEHNRSRRGQP